MATVDQPPLEFDALYRLKQFLEQFRARHIAALLPFEDKRSGGFKQSEGRADKAELSMSSTGTCVGSLVQTGLWNSPIDPLKKDGRGWWVGREKTYYKGLLTQEWTSAALETNNPFTVGWVIEACHHLKAIGKIEIDATLEKRWAEALQVLRDSLSKRGDDDDTPIGSVSVLKYPPSSYLTQLVCRALKIVNELTPELAAEATKWALREVAFQTSLIVADSRAADPLHLAYAIICGIGYQPLSERKPVDLEIIGHGLKVFFAKQLPNGGWPQSRPLFHYPAFGSAYCYDYETLAQLLLCTELHEMLFQFIPQLAKAAYALESTKFELRNGAFGWSSYQTPQLAGPESWSTASVYLFLYALDRLLAEAIRRTIASEVEVRYLGIRLPQENRENFAEKFLDCPLSAKKGETETLKPTLFARLVKPVAEKAAEVSKGQKLPKAVPVSAILFGPPGTSKTEIVEQIASYIGWPTITVDPSYFVKHGMDQIQAQANRIFRMLAAAEQMVVLFDEFDEMVRRRADAEEILSRFLTTAMLPKLATISKERRILFLVATNYIDSFDIAISRPGRFDLVIQMMPPLAQAKLDYVPWKQTLTWLGDIVGSSFEEKLAEFTFLETEKLVARVANLSAAADPGAAKAEARQVWKEAIERCTSNAYNDARRTGKKQRRWRDTARDDVRFIRLH